MRQQRFVDRSEYVGFRCPRDLKRRLEEMGRKRIRDVSSLALEFINSGLAKAEAEELMKARQLVGAQ